jgi:APA family basic amino acid/polyamine antiporter
LAAMMPEAGGEYAYLREAYGPMWGFLYGWMQFLIGKPGSIATLGAGFAIYFGYFFPTLSGKLVSFSLICLLGGVNYFGVKASGAVQEFFTFLKIALILGLVGGALFSGHGDWSNFSTSIPVAGKFTGFIAALVAALWAYDGWNNVTMVAGEVSNPRRNLPLALIAGTAVVGALYMLANVAYFYVLPAAKVAAADRVASDVAGVFMGNKGGAFVAIAAMVSIFAAINGSILSGSRVPFAMAADGRFFKTIATVHPRFHGPSNSVIFLCAVAAMLSLTGTYKQLFSYVIFASWIFYGITAAAVIALRIKRPHAERPYRCWGYPVLPAIFVIVAAALSVSILLSDTLRSLAGLGIIAVGVPAFYYFEKIRKAAAVLLLMGFCGLHARAATPPPAPRVMVFALGDRAGLRSLSEHSVDMDVLSPQAFIAHANGNVTGRIHPDIADGASRANLPMMPAVVNEDFSPETTRALLDSPAARKRVVASLVEMAGRLQLPGFVIDFEALPRDQREHYTYFLALAQREFHAADLKLGVAIPPPQGNAKEADDFAAVGRLADTVILMAYDQHSRTGPPGPIAAYDWVERALSATLEFIPCEKLFLGVPLYHRKWTAEQASATTGSHREALALADQSGVELQWDEAARSPWFQRANQTVWLENSRSLAEKLSLATRYHLAGIAAWRLGQEDPDVWNVLGEYRKQ